MNKLLKLIFSCAVFAWSSAWAVDTTFNKVNINLVGLAQTGIEYTPVS